MRQPMVAGNWKMHGSHARNQELLSALLPSIRALPDRVAEVVVCPPSVYLESVGRALAAHDGDIRLGAQNACTQSGQGAYTGEVSVEMLRDVGCTHVILGHSERRTLFAETDEAVADKLRVALAAGLTPIICVGEQLAEREAGETEAVVERQLTAVLAACPTDQLAGIVLAYEPVWAIGTGLTATPEQAQEVHQFIRTRIARVDATMAGLVRILYGGSVKAANAKELFAMPDVDGGLIGGASLTTEFTAIVAAAGAH